MSGGNDEKLSQRLYERVKELWPQYPRHPFVTQMAEGTLPVEKFRYYMLQDYLYLRDYVKIFAAIIQKADDFEQIRFLSTQLSDTIGETYRTHLPYMRRAHRTCGAFELLLELCLCCGGDGQALPRRPLPRELRRMVCRLCLRGVPEDQSGADRPDRQAGRIGGRGDDTAPLRDI